MTHNMTMAHNGLLHFQLIFKRILFILFVYLLFTGHALADCVAVNGFIGVPTTIVNPLQQIPVPTIDKTGSFSAGQTIASYYGVDSATTFSGCGNTSRAAQFIYPVKTATGITSSSSYGIADVYPTGVQGIGYSVIVKDHILPPYAPLLGSVVRFFNDWFAYDLGQTTYVYFVATETLKSGAYNIPRQQVATIGTHGLNTSGSSSLATSAIWISGFTLNIVAPNPTCSLSTARATFDMGALKTSDFNKGTGGTYNWVADQSLVASGTCNASTASMTFAGTADTAYPNAFKNNGSAKGVALELWKAGTPQVIPNSMTPITFTAGANQNFTFSARYIQTEPTVTAGSVSATVTATVNYE